MTTTMLFFCILQKLYLLDLLQLVSWELASVLVAYFLVFLLLCLTTRESSLPYLIMQSLVLHLLKLQHFFVFWWLFRFFLRFSAVLCKRLLLGFLCRYFVLSCSLNRCSVAGTSWFFGSRLGATALYTIGWFQKTPYIVPERYWVAKYEQSSGFVSFLTDIDMVILSHIVSVFIWIYLAYLLGSVRTVGFPDHGWALGHASLTHSALCNSYYVVFIFIYDLIFLCSTESDYYLPHVAPLIFSCKAVCVDYAYQFHTEMTLVVRECLLDYELRSKDYGLAVSRNLRSRNTNMRHCFLLIVGNTYFNCTFMGAILNCEVWDGSAYDDELDDSPYAASREPYRFYPYSWEEDYAWCSPGIEEVYFTNYMGAELSEYRDFDYEPTPAELATLKPTEYFCLDRYYKGICIEPNLASKPDKYGMFTVYTPKESTLNLWIHKHNFRYLLEWVEPGIFFDQFSFAWV